ncbi:hypothetical protein Hdeb2414_s0017g00502861 [Helianthus debilis subsp. tardiflorus]
MKRRTKMGFGTRWVLDGNRSVRMGCRPTRVSARDGFRIATGFRPTRSQYFQFFLFRFGFANGIIVK